MNQVICRCSSDLVGYSCSLAFGELVSVYPRPQTISGSCSQYFSRQLWVEDSIFTENIAEFCKPLTANRWNHFFDHYPCVILRSHSSGDRVRAKEGCSYSSEVLLLEFVNDAQDFELVLKTE